MKEFSDTNVTALIAGVKGGDEEAALRIWNHYVERLVAVAQRRLEGIRQGAADGEDVVQEAFFSLIRGAQAGRFRRLEDRSDLWQILVMLTGRKAAKARDREQALKRGGGKVLGESAFARLGADGWPAGIAQAIEATPTPADLDELASSCEHLLMQLDDGQRQVALWRLEGYSHAEIADRVGKSIRWVERKAEIIRRMWRDELTS